MQVEVVLLLLGFFGGQPGLLPSLAAAPPRFLPRERAVEGWRREAALDLDATPAARAALLLGRDPPALGRCIRLNNYWCIKRGGWAGEIAADAEGHVAFASAGEGAAVAALLLRRYYVDYGRRSARAIVARWAPASCGAASASAPRGAPDGLARRGIGGTLRARWLAAHRGRAAGAGRTRVRASAVRERPVDLPAPVIALGLAAAPAGVAAALPDLLAASKPSPRNPAVACAGEARRIDNYAARAAAGIVASTEADLGLFDPAGRPTPHLARLMRNMAAVEIGPFGAAPALVEAAVARASALVAAKAKAADSGAAGRGRLDEAPRPEPDP